VPNIIVVSITMFSRCYFNNTHETLKIKRFMNSIYNNNNWMKIRNKVRQIQKTQTKLYLHYYNFNFKNNYINHILYVVSKT